MEEQTITINLHKYQDAAIFADNKFVAAIAGVQSGKTMAGAVWVQKKMLDLPKGNGLIMANDYKMLDQSTLPKLFEVNPGLRRFYKQQRGVIEIPYKNEAEQNCLRRIYIRSAERPESIEGFTVDWAWLDEAAKYKLDAWINVQARVAIKKGQIFISTTPDTMNWLYYDFYDRFLKGDKDFKVVQWTSIDNPYFSTEEYERAKRTMSPQMFRKRYEGTFQRMEGLVYQLEPNQVISPQEIISTDCFAGVDFGFKNPSAITIIKLGKDGIYYIVDEVYRPEMTTDEIIELCKGLRDKHNITRFYADPAEPDRIEAMRRAGLNMREVTKDITAGVDEVRNIIFQGRLKVFNTCKHHIEEFSLYHYDTPKEDQNEKELPVKKDDHLMDALRYALTTYSYVPPRPKIYNYQALNQRTGY